jgi:hypothetical protein
MMAQIKRYQWLIVLGIGIMGGLIVSRFWPHTPLYAVATDRIDTFAMATGPLDAEVEAVYFLDFLTGDLTALVLGKQPGVWSGYFHGNVSADLGIDQQRNPKFMMVTGVVNLRRGGGSRQLPSSAMCYVAEVTGGRVAAYAIPWSPSMYAAGQSQSGPLVRVGTTHFREALDEGPPATPSPAPGAKKARARGQ